MKYIILILLIFFGAQLTLEADVKNWTLEQVGFLNIDRNEEDYGGFSGLITHKQGSEALLVTDKSFYFVLELLRNEDDNLTGFSVSKKGRILSSKGEQLTGRNTDSESIVINANNNYFISFESNHRIMMHRSWGKDLCSQTPLFKLYVNKV